MGFPKNPAAIDRDLNKLAPFFRSLLEVALSECWELGFQIKVFEAFRTPERQDFLFEQGRTRPGKIITKAKSWRSWHQYGLAVDLVFQKNGVWTWDKDFDYDKPASILKEYGFEWLYPFEQSHFQITGGLPIREAEKLAKGSGVEAVWEAVESKFANSAR